MGSVGGGFPSLLHTAEEASWTLTKIFELHRWENRLLRKGLRLRRKTGEDQQAYMKRTARLISGLRSPVPTYKATCPAKPVHALKGQNWSNLGRPFFEK